MAIAKKHSPALRFAAIFSSEVPLMDRACQLAVESWGEIVLCSSDLPFDSTSYYFRTMGQPLFKRLVAFRELIDPIELVESKHQSNAWEQQLQVEKQTELASSSISEPAVERVVNIDAGYLNEAKVVLATMKDRDHRLSMGRGVFAEVTLFFQLPGRWEKSRWTYPDFQLPAYHQFFMECRRYLRDQFSAANSNAADP